MSLSTTRLAAVCATAAVAFGLAACGGGTATTPAAPAAGAAAPSAPAAATDADPDDATENDTDNDTDNAADDTTTAGAKVSANTASEDEIANALDAAGVSNPGRWADEVVEYRPYPADDPDLTKLRTNLKKYNPGQATTDKIVSVLTP